MNYILTENQYNFLVEGKKFKGRTPEQVEKEITDFVIKNNIQGRKELQKSEDRDNGWSEQSMYNAAKVLKVLDKDGNEITLLNKLFSKKTDEEKIKEITDFVIKNNIQGRKELQKSEDRDNGWGKSGMYDAAKVLKVLDKDGNEITLLNKLFSKKTDEEKIKEITDFVIKNNIQGRSEFYKSEDLYNDWGRGGMYTVASDIKVLDKDGNEITLLDKLFSKKTDEEKIKEIKDFIIKNNIQGRTELGLSSDPENDWGKGMMYRFAGPTRRGINILDELFPFEKKEWLGEKKVSEVLEKMGYEVIRGNKNLNPGIAIRQFTFNDCFSPKGTEYCHRLKMDFYLITDKNKKIVIEYNGEQHYKSVESWGGDEGLKYRQECDKAKADYCEQNGIRLIVIPYWHKNNIEEIITSQIIPYNKVQEGDIYIKNKNIMAKKIIRLTESDLTRLVKRVIQESKYLKPTGMDRWMDDEKGSYVDDIENFDTDYDEEEFDDYDSFSEKHPGSTRHFNFGGDDAGKGIFDKYKDKYGPLKVRSRRSMD